MYEEIEIRIRNKEMSEILERKVRKIIILGKWIGNEEKIMMEIRKGEIMIDIEDGIVERVEKVMVLGEEEKWIIDWNVWRIEEKIKYEGEMVNKVMKKRKKWKGGIRCEVGKGEEGIVEGREEFEVGKKIEDDRLKEIVEVIWKRIEGRRKMSREEIEIKVLKGIDIIIERIFDRIGGDVGNGKSIGIEIGEIGIDEERCGKEIEIEWDKERKDEMKGKVKMLELKEKLIGDIVKEINEEEENIEIIEKLEGGIRRLSEESEFICEMDFLKSSLRNEGGESGYREEEEKKGNRKNFIIMNRVR